MKRTSVKGASVLGIIVATGLLAIAPPASASHVQCGDTITQDTVLDSDIVCTGSESASAAVTIAASDVRLQMADHTISQTGSGLTAGISVGSFSSGRVSNVEVRRGTVSGFPIGIQMLASDSAILKVHALALGTGFEIDGSGNYVHRSAVERVGSFPSGSFGIRFTTYSGCGCTSNDAYTWRNTVSGFETGIYSDGNAPRHYVNEVSDCASNPAGRGIRAVAFSTGAVVHGNTVTNCSVGIEASAGDGTFDDGESRVRWNSTSSNTSTGLIVSDSTGIVNHNTSNGNTDHGISIVRSGTVVKNNNAHMNGGFGISVVPGIVDGGGNNASGNFDGQPENQCYPPAYISCNTSPPV
jgi:parallel beta-helix repeat protein